MDSQTVLTLNTSTHTNELSRLLSAAVVSPKFCKLLLSEPETALRVGYQSEAFHLTPQEQMWILSIRAKSLADFASELVNYQSRSQCTQIPILPLETPVGVLFDSPYQA